jgi:hypothetical protein
VLVKQLKRAKTAPCPTHQKALPAGLPSSRAPHTHPHTRLLKPHVMPAPKMA